MNEILWVDSDPNISDSAGPLCKLDCQLRFFNETQDCLDYIINKNQDPIFCIITSMMERGGRKEKGLMNAFQMINQIRYNWKRSYSPFLVMITCTADVQQCKDFGFDVIVHGDRNRMMNIVIQRFKNKSNAYYKTLWREPNLLPCLQLREFAKEVLNSLNIDPSYMDPFADRCFCENCEPKKVWYRGEPQEKYVLPTGFYRYGIKLRDEYLNNKIKVYDWNVAYHGTKNNIVKSIVEHRRIMFPGDVLNDGTILGVRNGQIFSRDTPAVYLTPSITYACCEYYARSFTFKGRNVKVVIQCRLKPGSFKKHPETIGARKTIDNNFSNTTIEWVTTDREAVVPYGLLIGVMN